MEPSDRKGDFKMEADLKVSDLSKGDPNMLGTESSEWPEPPEETILARQTDPIKKAQMQMLLEAIRRLGWTRVDGRRLLKPNLRAYELFYRKELSELCRLFDSSWAQDRPRTQFIEHLNRYLIPIWFLQLEPAAPRSDRDDDRKPHNRYRIVYLMPKNACTDKLRS